VLDLSDQCFDSVGQEELARRGVKEPKCVLRNRKGGPKKNRGQV